VDLARQNDPRVIQYEKQEKERMEKIREEKRLEKLKRREEEDKRQQEALEAKRLKEQQEAEEKKRKEDELKEIRRQKKNKLDLTKQLIAQKVNLPDYGPLFVDFFFEGVTPEEHDAVLAELNQELPLEEMRERFRRFVAAVKERQNPANHKKAVPTPKENKLANMSKWSDEEIALLTKGILKYPAGIGGRWEKITDLIGGSKTIHEVTAMAKDLSIKNVRGEKNILNTMEEAIKEKNTASTKQKSLHANSEPLPSKEEKQPATPSPQDWSQTQQKQLEAALKKYPATLDKKERWTKISEAVEGKSAKECLDRVKEIKEKLAKKAD
jgi:DnaJ homolog subfamily C member 2